MRTSSVGLITAEGRAALVKAIRSALRAREAALTEEAGTAIPSAFPHAHNLSMPDTAQTAEEGGVPPGSSISLSIASRKAYWARVFAEMKSDNTSQASDALLKVDVATDEHSTKILGQCLPVSSESACLSSQTQTEKPPAPTAAERPPPPVTASPEGVAGVSAAPADSGTLTAEQSTILRLALDGASLFIGGKAGTGKSFLLREIARHLSRRHGLSVAVTAATGVAALNIDGNTFHSTFSVPVIAEDSCGTLGRVNTSRARPRRGDRESGRGRCAARHQGEPTFDPHTLAGVDVIIVDEVSMLHAGYLEALELAARHAPGKRHDRPFGGTQIILSGDFMQLTPFRGSVGGRSLAAAQERAVCVGVEPVGGAALRVERSGEGKAKERCASPIAAPSSLCEAHERHPVAHYCDQPLYRSYVFHHALVHAQLTEPVRQVADPQFVADLNELRCGRLPYRLSRCAHLNPPDPDAIRLFATKGAVHTYNERKMLELDGEEQTFRTHLQLRPVGGSPDTAAGKEAAPDARNALSETALLHFAPQRAARRRATMREPELSALVTDLCTTAGVPVEAVRTYAMPCPVFHYAANLSTVAVRCSGPSAREATRRLQRLLDGAQERLSRSSANTPCADPLDVHRVSEVKDSVRATPTRPMFPSSPRWCLVRVEGCPTRRLASLLQPGMQQRFLKAVRGDMVLQSKTLKVGCRVMLLRNLTAKYVNGSLGRITEFRPLVECGGLLPAGLKVVLPRSHHAIARTLCTPSVALKVAGGEAEVSASACPPEGLPEAPQEVEEGPRAVSVRLPIVRMDADGKLVAIPWVALPLPASLSDFFFVSTVVCMPLTPAYAFTVHKIQGVTLDHSILFDGSGMFPCDHLLYVAASRVRSFSRLRWVHVSPRMITVHRPSLAFSESIPRAADAEATWTARWATDHVCGARVSGLPSGLTKTMLFLPNWRLTD